MFLGYFKTNVTLTDTASFPLSPSENDDVQGVYQLPDSTTRMAQHFIFNGTIWVADGDAVELTSIDPFLLPLEQRATNVFDTYGMGVLPLHYAFINDSKLAGWVSEDLVGNDTIIDTDLELWDTLNGVRVFGAVPTTGLLPVYIKNATKEIVGVGSAVYTGVWRVLWYKLVVSAGVVPTVACNSEFVIKTGIFLMKGDTTAYTLEAYWGDSEPGQYEEVAGAYSEGVTQYNIASAVESWLVLRLLDSSGIMAYAMVNELKASLVETDNRLSADAASRIPRDLSSKILTDIDLDIDAEGAIFTVKSMDPTVDADPLDDEEFVIPVVTDEGAGLMSPTMLAQFTQAREDILALESAGGSYAGTYDVYEVGGLGEDPLLTAFPLAGTLIEGSGININDFVYVLRDEEHNNLRTVYIARTLAGDATKFIFTYLRDDSTPALQIATDMTLGIVKSSQEDGQIYVHSKSGKMMLVGYSDLLSRLNTIESKISQLGGLGYAAPTTGGPLSGVDLTSAMAHLDLVLQGLTSAIIDHAE